MKRFITIPRSQHQGILPHLTFSHGLDPKRTYILEGTHVRLPKLRRYGPSQCGLPLSPYSKRGRLERRHLSLIANLRKQAGRKPPTVVCTATNVG